MQVTENMYYTYVGLFLLFMTPKPSTQVKFILFLVKHALSRTNAPKRISQVIYKANKFLFTKLSQHNSDSHYEETTIFLAYTNRVIERIFSILKNEYDFETIGYWLEIYGRAYTDCVLNGQFIEDEQVHEWGNSFIEFIDELRFIYKQEHKEWDAHVKYVQSYLENNKPKSKGYVAAYKEKLKAGKIIHSKDSSLVKILVPNLQPKKVSFKPLNDKQNAALLSHLKDNDITPNPQELVDFLNGRNPIEKIPINTNKIPHMAYLLKCLKGERVISMKGSSQYVKLFERYTCPFGLSVWANGQVEYEGKKMTRNNWDDKTDPIDDFAQHLLSLKPKP